jgi:hypothetical protein
MVTYFSYIPLGLPNYLFPSDFPSKTLYAFLFSGRISVMDIETLYWLDGPGIEFRREPRF